MGRLTCAPAAAWASWCSDQCQSKKWVSRRLPRATPACWPMYSYRGSISALAAVTLTALGGLLAAAGRTQRAVVPHFCAPRMMNWGAGGSSISSSSAFYSAAESDACDAKILYCIGC